MPNLTLIDLKDRGIIASTSLIEDLSKQDSLALHRATTEPFSYLAHLKHFSQKPT